MYLVMEIKNVHTREEQLINIVKRQRQNKDESRDETRHDETNRVEA
jgi:hypothetical protein